MKVCDKVDMGEYIQMFEHAYGSYHHGRKCTDGEGLNVYDGRVGGQCWGNTVHRCGRDCLQHEYYLQEWDQSFMPLIARIRNVLVTETTQVTRFIDELSIRLLDIATCVFDFRLQLSHRGHATISLSTMG